MSYRLAGKARSDLLEIWSHIADDNETAADRFVDLLIRHFRTLGGNPYAGRNRDEIRIGYRSFLSASIWCFIESSRAASRLCEWCMAAAI